jgi:hypothetical protein
MKRISLQTKRRGFTLHLLLPLLVGVMLSIVSMEAAIGPSPEVFRLVDTRQPRLSNQLGLQ